MYDNLTHYMLFYKKFLFQSWDNLGPQEYVIILLMVGAVGWYMMRKAARM